jgi:hypothetical protein
MQPPCPRRAPHSGATATNNFEGKRAFLFAAKDLAFERAGGLHSRVGRPRCKIILPIKRFARRGACCWISSMAQLDVRMNARAVKAKQDRSKVVAQG